MSCLKTWKELGIFVADSAVAVHYLAPQGFQIIFTEYYYRKNNHVFEGFRLTFYNINPIMFIMILY